MLSVVVPIAASDRCLMDLGFMSKISDALESSLRTESVAFVSSSSVLKTGTSNLDLTAQPSELLLGSGTLHLCQISHLLLDKTKKTLDSFKSAFPIKGKWYSTFSAWRRVNGWTPIY